MKPYNYYAIKLEAAKILFLKILVLVYTCSFSVCVSRAGDTVGATLPLFCVAKRKKGIKGKKERFSKQKLLEGCHQYQNVTVLAILERLEFKKKFYGRSTMVADNPCLCFTAPPL